MRTETLVSNRWLLTSVKERWPIRCIRLLSFGKWGNLPHGVQLVFHDHASVLQGATINWGNGDERVLAQLRFDGSVLEFQMEPETPMFRMVADHDQFQGCSLYPNGQRGPTLKMIKYAAV